MNYVKGSYAERNPRLYNYHVDLIPAEGAVIYRASFALDPECTNRFNAEGSAPTVGACLDDITEWRESVLDGEK